MGWYTEYKRSLKMARVEEYLDLFFYRPLAFLLVKAVYNTRITPDNLTLGAIIMGLTAGVFYSLGQQWAANIGALFFALFIVFDCSDGQLARLKKNGTPVGRILDGIADYIASLAVYVGIAVGFSQNEDQPSYMLGLLLLSGISVSIQSMLVDLFRTRFLDIVLHRNSSLDEGIQKYRKEYIRLKNTRSKWLDRNIIFIYIAYTNIQKKFTSKRKIEYICNASADEYYKKNKELVRLWILIGPSAVRTTLIICSLFNRFDIYFWITIVAFNIYVALLWMIQQQVDRTYAKVK